MDKIMKSELMIVKIVSVLLMVFVSILMTSCGGGDGEKDYIEPPGDGTPAPAS